MFQTRRPVKVDREAYEGPIAEVKAESQMVETAPPVRTHHMDSVVMGDDMPAEFHSRPPTRAGGRNLQDSSFSFSGS